MGRTESRVEGGSQARHSALGPPAHGAAPAPAPEAVLADALPHLIQPVAHCMRRGGWAHVDKVKSLGRQGRAMGPMGARRAHVRSPAAHARCGARGQMPAQACATQGEVGVACCTAACSAAASLLPDVC